MGTVDEKLCRPPPPPPPPPPLPGTPGIMDPNVLRYVLIVSFVSHILFQLND